MPSDRQKMIKAIVTMAGPDGKSNSRDPHRPPITDKQPKIEAKTAIISGALASWRAPAAGMIVPPLIG